jgi:hypothetical protein
MGNPPKKDPVRRNARVGPLKLPAEGRDGPPPKWPLPGKMRAGELAVWRDLWSTPQAVAWERFRWARTVARYCRLEALLERDVKEPMSAEKLAEVRQLEDRLGLNPKAMRLLLWEVVGDELAQKREERQSGESARGRLKAVE